jgi:hypothetical protein
VPGSDTPSLVVRSWKEDRITFCDRYATVFTGHVAVRWLDKSMQPNVGLVLAPHRILFQGSTTTDLE